MRPPFGLACTSPLITVTYSYSGNDSFGSADNFTPDIESSSDDQSIANDIASSGGKTTTVYPDTTLGGNAPYHLSVQATGDWQFSLSETC